ncbi:hypothetical protein V6Z12_D11G159300 [Gossypium hirsutum]
MYLSTRTMSKYKTELAGLSLQGYSYDLYRVLTIRDTTCHFPTWNPASIFGPPHVFVGTTCFSSSLLSWGLFVLAMLIYLPLAGTGTGTKDVESKSRSRPGGIEFITINLQLKSHIKNQALSGWQLHLQIFKVISIYAND